MPIFMDRHDVPGSITSEDVAHIHQQDLKVQHKFGCRALSYWFDEKRNKAFCLVEAPDRESMVSMHEHAHGQVPNKVIEVEETLLESFLGTLEHPEHAKGEGLFVNHDPPERTIMVVNIKISSFKKSSFESLQKSLESCNQITIKVINNYEGNIVRHQNDCFLISFVSVTNAVSCALKIQSAFNTLREADIRLKIGINTGIPVTDKDQLFETAINLAERICTMTKEQIVVSSEVKDLYKSENLNVFVDSKLISVLHPSDEEFLDLLMDFVDKSWKDPLLKVEDFGKHLGYSKSQLYRKMVSLTGKSPNTLIKDYRLNEAINLLNKQRGNVSEIAFETGFNSPAYFSKCFAETYGMLPSDYVKQVSIFHN